MDHHDRFTEEALRSQDGKKVPFTRELGGGEVIGEATLRYDPGAGALVADIQVDDTKVAESLGEKFSSVIFKTEKTESTNCPRCGGSGTIPVYPGGGFALNPGNRPEREITCPACKGTGKKES
jgi:DnaJ-class molecular chaperone